MKIIVLFLLSMITLSSYSQVKGDNVSGKLVDNNDKAALIGVYISLTNDGDGSKLYAISDNDGAFLFKKVPAGNYTLFARYIGYANIEKKIKVEEQAVHLNLSMKYATIALDGVVKTAVQPRTNIVGDTVQMNADAYKTNEDATASDLVKKMPTIVVTNGTVQAQGEDVKKVLVDGKEFFGNDANAALNNLPANAVERIDIYDDETDQAKLTGVSSGNTTKTMNIILRPGMKKGVFGKLAAGVGYKDKYTAGGNINIFNGDQRISIVGLSNNINVQNFSAEDLMGVSSSNGGGRSRRGRDDGTNNFLVSQQGGITKTNSIGINYQDIWAKKVTVVGSYFFNETDNRNEVKTLQDYFTTNQHYVSESSSNSTNINHRFNLKLDYKIDDYNLIRFIPRLTVQENKGNSSLNSTLGLDGNPITTVDNNVLVNRNAVKSNNQLMYQHKFKTEGRTFVTNLTGNFAPQNATNEQHAITEDYSKSSTDSVNQLSKLNNHDNTYGANFSYTEPLSKESNVNIGYSYNRELSDANKITSNYSPYDDDYTLLDTALSNVVTNDFYTSSGNLGYRLSNEKIKFSLNATYQVDNLKNDQTFPYIASANKQFTNFLPRLRFRYSISKTQHLSFDYRSTTKNPSAGQLQNAVDNSNILQLSSGNPDLNQQTGQQITLRYFKMSENKTSMLFSMISASMAKDYITSNSIYAANDTIIDGISMVKGAYLTRPENIDGYRNIRGFLAYGTPLAFIKSNLNLHANGSWTRTPGLINNELNMSISQNYGVGVVISSNISKNVDFTVSSRSQKDLSNNSLNVGSKTNYFTQNSSVDLNWTFGPGINFQTKITHQYKDGYDASVKKSVFLCNGGIGKKMFKNKGELSLMVYDLFKQNNSLSQTTTDYYTQQQQSLTLQRYIMLTFTYRINKFKSGSAPTEDDMPHHWGPRPPGHGPML